MTVWRMARANLHQLSGRTPVPEARVPSCVVPGVMVDSSTTSIPAAGAQHAGYPLSGQRNPEGGFLVQEGVWMERSPHQVRYL